MFVLHTGVSSIEWVKTINDAGLENKEAFCVTKQVLVYFIQKSTRGEVTAEWKLLGDDADLTEFIKKKYKYPVCVDYYKQAVANFSNYVKGSGVSINL